MRTLFVVDALFEDKPGGSRVAARELARYLALRGHEVTFLSPWHGPRRDSSPDPAAFQVVRYDGAGEGLRFILSGWAAARKLWSERQFDVVHVHFAYAAVGPDLGLPGGVPRVRTFHGPWDLEGWVEDTRQKSRARMARAVVKRFLRFVVERRNLARSSRVITLSQFFRGDVVRRFGVPEERVTVAPGGVDLERFRPAADRGALREALKIPVGSCVLLTIRRLSPRMGLENLVDAMVPITRTEPRALLLVGGTGPESERLQGLVQHHGLTNNVRMLGFIPDADLAAYYQAADLFVLPTTALEGFGLVTVEALACGTPVVGTPVGATPEILEGLDPRLVTQGAGPTDLAEGVLSALRGRWLTQTGRERIREYAARRYSWDFHTDVVEATYADALRDHGVEWR